MVLNEKQKECLNQEFEGYELCPHCGRDTSFRIVPFDSIEAKCEHCGEEITICSLCDMPHGCGGSADCKEGVWETLLADNGLFGNEDE